MTARSFTPLTIAALCFSALRAQAEAYGQPMPTWEEAAPERQQAVVDEVMMYLNNPELTCYQAHGAWIDTMLAAGWSRGPEYSADKKQHPGLMPFVDLPAERQAEKLITRTLVLELAPFLTPITPANGLPESELTEADLKPGPIMDTPPTMELHPPSGDEDRAHLVPDGAVPEGA